MAQPVMPRMAQSRKIVRSERSAPVSNHSGCLSSATASRDASGKIHVSLVNLHPSEPITVSATLEGVTAGAVTGRVLTAAAMNAHNTFAAPDAVKPVAFTGAKLAGDQLTIALSAMSVVVLEL